MLLFLVMQGITALLAQCRPIRTPVASATSALLAPAGRHRVQQVSYVLCCREQVLTCWTYQVPTAALRQRRPRPARATALQVSRSSSRGVLSSFLMTSQAIGVRLAHLP